MTEEQRKSYDQERKVFSLLTQALPKDILHQFDKYQTTFSLWNALGIRCEGDESVKKVRKDQIEKEFESFCAFGNKSLEDLSTRYTHLTTKIEKVGLKYSNYEIIERFAEALPSHRTYYLDILKGQGIYHSHTIEGFVTMLKNNDYDDEKVNTWGILHTGINSANSAESDRHEVQVFMQN